MFKTWRKTRVSWISDFKILGPRRQNLDLIFRGRNMVGVMWEGEMHPQEEKSMSRREIRTWLLWLSGLNTNLRTKRSLVQFPVRAMPRLQARSPVGGMREAIDQCISCTLMFFSLCFSLHSPLSLKIDN